MNIRFLTAVSTLGCALFASCYPYDESRDRRQPPVTQNSVSSVDQQKVQAQRDAMKERAQPKQETTTTELPETDTTTLPSNEAKPPVETKRAEYDVANKVPGKDGFVFSPYNNKIVDVRDIPAGTLVQDPTYTGAGKGYFRVP